MPREMHGRQTTPSKISKRATQMSPVGFTHATSVSEIHLIATYWLHRSAQEPRISPRKWLEECLGEASHPSPDLNALENPWMLRKLLQPSAVR